MKQVWIFNSLDTIQVELYNFYIDQALEYFCAITKGRERAPFKSHVADVV